MRDFLLDEQAFQVLKSFRPYFGEQGNHFLTALENMQELLGSEPAKKMAESLRLFGIGENRASMEVKEEAERNPYSLFLILPMMFAADIPGMIPKRNNAPDSVQEQLPPPIISYE